MSATYEALCEHGYTDLTAQNIADRTDTSKSLLFYHYGSKEELVAAFIDYLLERFDERVEEGRDQPPADRLAAFVDWFLYSPDDDERTSFHRAMLELRVQAAYTERYREQLRKSDQLFRDTLEEILRGGLESGDFRDHDPSELAALLIAAFDGARTRQLTIDRDAYLGEVRSAIVSEVIGDLLADDVPFEIPSDASDHREPTETTPDSSESDAETDQNGDDDAGDTTMNRDDAATRNEVDDDGTDGDTGVE